MTKHNDDQAETPGGKAPEPPAASSSPEEPAATPLNTPTASGAERPSKDGFNPLANEADMFKVLVGAVIFAAMTIALVLIVRAVL